MKYIKEPQHLETRYSHEGLCLDENEEVDECYVVHCEQCHKTIGKKGGYVFENPTDRRLLTKVCYEHFNPNGVHYHGPREPHSWQDKKPRSIKIMRTFFFTLIRNIQTYAGDSTWYVSAYPTTKM